MGIILGYSKSCHPFEQVRAQSSTEESLSSQLLCSPDGEDSEKISERPLCDAMPKNTCPSYPQNFIIPLFPELLLIEELITCYQRVE